MKKVLAIVLALCMVFALCACSGGAKKTDEIKIDQDINFLVHVKAGGALDVRARVIAEYLAKELGVNVTVTNVPGAGGATCMTQAKTQPTGDYDLVFATATVFGSLPIFTPDLAYTLDDFIPLAPVDVESFGLYACPAQTGIESFEDLVEYSKENKIIFGSGGVGNITHLMQAYLYKTLGMDAETLTHNGGIEGITNCMGGHNVVLMVGQETARPYVESGDIVPILTFSAEDYTGYEGKTVPSVLKVGGKDDNVYQSLMVIVCNATVDEAHEALLRDALNKVINLPECQADLKEVGLIYTPTMNEEELLTYLKDEYEAMGSSVEFVG